MLASTLRSFGGLLAFVGIREHVRRNIVCTQSQKSLIMIMFIMMIIEHSVNKIENVINAGY